MKLPIEANPAEDREEFKRRLEGTFYSKIRSASFLSSAIKSILMENALKKVECCDEMIYAENKIESYLKNWDNAKDKSGREAVISSVRKY